MKFNSEINILIKILVISVIKILLNYQAGLVTKTYSIFYLSFTFRSTRDGMILIALDGLSFIFK